ncbi:MAG: S-layer homology domain-containing protein [Clostridiales Family XIII bacterium]|jgi:hypothetical protein|nr:S-layer homology domain-containing protein [Clostridiales Family XIII bacterium]
MIRFKKEKNKALAFCLAVMMAVGGIGCAGFGAPAFAANTGAPAASFNDTAGHWGAGAVAKWSALNILAGYENGSFLPDNSITRGEFAVILDRVMRYEDTATNSFSDLDNAFYTDAILKANAAGIIKGDAGGTVRPKANITREEAAVLFARAFAFDEAGGGGAFNDASQISSWAAGLVSVMAQKNFIQGSNGTFRPKAGITRAEVVTILNNAVAGFYTQPGTYTVNTPGVVIVNAGGVTLEASSAGTLILAEGIGSGTVTLTNVKVSEKATIRGGGETHVAGGSIATLAVDKLKGAEKIIAAADAAIGTLHIVKGGQSVTLTGKFGDVRVDDKAPVHFVAATANTVTVTAEGAVISIDKDSSIATLTFTGTAKNAALNNAGTIGTLNIEAGATGMKIKNTGTIKTIHDKTGEIKNEGTTGGGGGGGGSTGGGKPSIVKVSVKDAKTVLLELDRAPGAALGVADFRAETTGASIIAGAVGTPAAITSASAIAGTTTQYSLTMDVAILLGHYVKVTPNSSKLQGGAKEGQYTDVTVTDLAALKAMLANPVVKVINLATAAAIDRTFLGGDLFVLNKTLRILPKNSLTIGQNVVVSGSGIILAEKDATFVNASKKGVNFFGGEEISLKLQALSTMIENRSDGSKMEISPAAGADMNLTSGTLTLKKSKYLFDGAATVKSNRFSAAIDWDLTDAARVTVANGAVVNFSDNKKLTGSGKLTVNAGGKITVSGTHALTGSVALLLEKNAALTVNDKAVLKTETNATVRGTDKTSVLTVTTGGKLEGKGFAGINTAENTVGSYVWDNSKWVKQTAKP